jgi:hypothetical protein
VTEAPEVVFDEDAHTYTLAGVLCPRSVTGLLKKYGLTTDFSKVPPHVLDMARQRGVAYAEGRRLILSGMELDPATIDPAIAGYLEGLRRWLEKRKPRIIETERPLVSPMGFGLRPDIICEIDGVIEVVDDKATYKLPASIGPQTGGYLIGRNSLYPHEPITRRRALWLKKDGTFFDPILNDPEDLTAFLDCLEADLKLDPWRRKYGSN